MEAAEAGAAAEAAAQKAAAASESADAAAQSLKKAEESSGGRGSLGGLDLGEGPAVDPNLVLKDLYIFPENKTDGNQQTAPVDLVAKKLGRRYLWNSGRKEATISDTATNAFYRFTVYKDRVDRNDGKADYMLTPAIFREVLYLPESYLNEEFGLYIERAGKSGYSILMDQAMSDRAEELTKNLEAEGGRN